VHNAALGVMLMAIAGCAGPNRVDPADVAALPDDFTLDVSVAAGRKVGTQHGAHLQPMRYVVTPDGALRSGDASISAGSSVDSLPGVIRMLNRQQMESLWALVREAGLADPSRREPPTNLALFAAPDDQTIYLAQIQASEVNWSVRGPAPITLAAADHSTADHSTEPTESIASVDPTLTALVKRLAALAWVSDEPAGAQRPPPVRYDFGPDPYARYREP
jgi:hypothetical protein